MLLLQENLPKKKPQNKKPKKTKHHPKNPKLNQTKPTLQQLHIYSIYSFTAHDGEVFSSPQGDAYASQDKRSWFIIYESLYKTWKPCGPNTEGWMNFLCKQDLRTRKTCGIVPWVTWYVTWESYYSHQDAI